MSLVKCEHCNIRIPARTLPLHLKHCVNYRRKLKAGTLVAPVVKKKKVEAKIVPEKPLTKKQLAAQKKLEQKKLAEQKKLETSKR